MVGVGALFISTVLSYALIFGKFGLPELGIQGAAVAAVIARFLECATLLTLTYKTRSPVAASLRELLGFDRVFFGRVIKPMLPVILNELFWSLGITTYNIIYGRLGTQSYAAINIVSTIEQVLFVIFIGISNATSVLVGNRIGAGKEDEAYVYAGRSLGIGIGCVPIPVTVLQGGGDSPHAVELFRSHDRKSHAFPLGLCWCNPDGKRSASGGPLCFKEYTH